MDAIAPAVTFLAAFSASADSKKEPRFTFAAGVFSRFFTEPKPRVEGFLFILPEPVVPRAVTRERNTAWTA